MQNYFYPFFPPLYISYSPNTTVNLGLKVVCLCVPPVLPEVLWSSAVCPEVFQRLVHDKDSQRRLPGHEEGSCCAPGCMEGNTCQETTHCKSLSISMFVLFLCLLLLCVLQSIRCAVKQEKAALAIQVKQYHSKEGTCIYHPESYT